MAFVLGVIDITHSKTARLFVEALTVLDVSVLDRMRGIIGDSYIVDVVLEGPLDEYGMVMDFGDVKPRIKQVLDQTIDHCLLVPTLMDGVTYEVGSLTYISPESLVEIHYQAPHHTMIGLPSEAVTPDSIIDYVTPFVREVLSESVTNIHLNLRHESIPDSFYQYSHGLRHHKGDCQRMVHGHRSKINVLRNGHRDHDLEALVAQRFHDAYVGTASDIVARYQKNDVGYVTFSYTSSQGLFKLNIPTDSCLVMESVSTVENIAQYMTDFLAEKCAGDTIEVYAYEGVGKGVMTSTS